MIFDVDGEKEASKEGPCLPACTEPIGGQGSFQGCKEGHEGRCGGWIIKVGITYLLM